MDVWSLVPVPSWSCKSPAKSTSPIFFLQIVFVVDHAVHKFLITSDCLPPPPLPARHQFYFTSTCLFVPHSTYYIIQMKILLNILSNRKNSFIFIYISQFNHVKIMNKCVTECTDWFFGQHRCHLLCSWFQGVWIFFCRVFFVSTMPSSLSTSRRICWRSLRRRRRFLRQRANSVHWRSTCFWLRTSSLSIAVASVSFGRSGRRWRPVAGGCLARSRILARTRALSSSDRLRAARREEVGPFITAESVWLPPISRSEYKK